MVVRHQGTCYIFAEAKGDQAQLLPSPDGIHWQRVSQLDVRKKNGEPIEPGPHGTLTATQVVQREDGEASLDEEGRLRWQLKPGANALQVQCRNLFGIDGPPVTAQVTFKP